MTRLTVFLSVLTALIFILVLNTFKSIPVSNEKFDLQKTQKEFVAHEELIKEVTAPKEVEGEAEVVAVEYAPVVDLNSPSLVAGSKIFGQCVACHGKGGEGKASQKAPHIGGQYEWYIEKQLTDMKSGARQNPAMAPVLKGLSAQDMKDVGAYVEKLPWDKEAYLASLKAKK